MEQARRGGRGGTFRKTIRKFKPKTEDDVVKKQDKLDKQLDKYWGKEPEVGILYVINVVQQALDKQLEEYMKGKKEEKKVEEKGQRR